MCSIMHARRWCNMQLVLEILNKCVLAWWLAAGTQWPSTKSHAQQLQQLHTGARVQGRQRRAGVRRVAGTLRGAAEARRMGMVQRRLHCARGGWAP